MTVELCDSYIARRRFLAGMLGGGAAALGAGVGVPLLAYVGNLHAAPPPDWMEIEQPDYALAPGTAKKLKYGPIIVLLIQTPGPESALKVFDATCTHLDCTVGYDRSENRIFCPCHQGYYRIDGSVISGPPARPLREFHVRFHDGKLIIAQEKENLEKAFAEPDA